MSGEVGFRYEAQRYFEDVTRVQELKKRKGGGREEGS